MKSITTIYAVVGILLELMLARAYQLATPGFRFTYQRFFGENAQLPAITEHFLRLHWVFYVPPMGMLLGILMAVILRHEQLTVHASYIGLILFLGLAALLSMALFLPFISTMGPSGLS
jgi:hypothetical protein